jgi:hypothetical protein
MTFIKFRRQDAEAVVEVAVAVEKIAAIEARYYQRDDRGEAFDYPLSRGEAIGDEDLAAKRLVRYFVVRDELGRAYSSRTASKAAREVLAGIWAGAV